MNKSVIVKRIISAGLAISLAFSTTACGSNAGQGAVETASTVSEGVASVASTDQTSAEKEKVQIDDFYRYVNEEWINNNALYDWEYTYTRDNDYSDVIYGQLTEIMETAKAEDFSEDDSMWKLIKYYEQLNNPEQRNEVAISTIKEMSDYVQNISTIDEFTALMTDETYSLFNDICSVHYILNSAGDNAPAFAPAPLFGYFNEITDEQRNIILAGYASAFECIGYSEEEAQRLADNAGKMDILIHDFYNNTSWNYDGYSESMWDAVECSVDLGTIAEELGYIMTDGWDPYVVVFMYEGYTDWLNNVVTRDNLEMLKAFYSASIVETLAGCGNKKMEDEFAAVIRKLGGAGPYDEDTDDELYAMAQLMNIEEGALDAYYASKYISESQKQMVDELTSDILNAYVQVIKEIDWLDMRQRERLNVKVKKTQFLVGHIDNYNKMEDVEIKDNVIETTLEILKSNRSFTQGCLFEGTRIVPGNFNMYYPNAIYYSNENAVVISNGYFANEALWNEASYEERLATIGRVIAHELGHEFDSNSVGLKTDGVYDSNWDNFWDAYYQSFEPLFYYYDGMTTEYGNTLNGASVCNESFADMVALKILLGIMSNLDNPDYDAFFTAYAADQAAVMRPEYEALLLSQDTHATARERVNGILAQCDEFYDTYEVSKDSSFYVKPEDRIKIFEISDN